MQSLNAIMPEGKVTASSTGVAGAGKVSGDFQKVMTDMKSADNSRNTTDMSKKVSGIQKKNVSLKQKGAYKNTTDKIQQLTQVPSDDNVIISADAAETPAFSKGDFLQVENEIGSVVQDVMDMDPDVFQQVLASMGITAIQLLDPTVLQQFVVKANGGDDPTDLLTSEDMMQQFSELSAALLEADWTETTGFTGQQLSSMTAGQLDDSDFTELINDVLSEDVTQQDADVTDNGGDQKQVVFDGLQNDQGQSTVTEDGITVAEKPVTAESDQDAPMVPNDEEETTVLPAAAEKETASTDTVKDLAKITEAEVTVPSDSVVENVLDADPQSMMQDPSRQGEDSEGQADILNMHYDQPQETATETPVQTMMSFVKNMVQAANSDVEQVQQPVSLQQMIDIVNQVVERIHSSLQDETTTLEMQLNPERLGKMLLSVSSKEGVMTASFTVQNAEAKAALESQMITLRENLEQKNLKVDAVEVSVSDFTFTQSGGADTGDQKNYQQGNGKRSRFRFETDDEEDEDQKKTAQTVRRGIMPDSGSSVDFTA